MNQPITIRHSRDNGLSPLLESPHHLSSHEVIEERGFGRRLLDRIRDNIKEVRDVILTILFLGHAFMFMLLRDIRDGHNFFPGSRLGGWLASSLADET